MELQIGTSTKLRRLNSAIYAIKELISAQKLDGSDFMIDTLMTSYYGIDEIVIHIEEKESEALIKRQQEYLKNR